MKNKQNNGFIKNPFLYILIIVVVITGFQYFSAGSSVGRSQQINYTELVKEIRNGNVKDISYQPNGSVIEVAGTYKKEKKVKVPNFTGCSVSEAKALAQAHNLNIEITGNDLSSGNVKAYRQSEKQGSMVAQGKVVVVSFKNTESVLD